MNSHDLSLVNVMQGKPQINGIEASSHKLALQFLIIVYLISHALTILCIDNQQRPFQLKPGT